MLRMLRHVPRAEATAAGLSVGVSILLLGLKFVAYYMTGSAAIFSDALESIVNVVASLVAAWSLVLAHQPADELHPYGHGKAEFLSAGFEGGMILLAALVIVQRAIEEMVRGPEVHQVSIGLGLIFLAGAINGAVGLYLVRAGRRGGSATLLADGKHLLSDAVTSGAVLAALVVLYFKPTWTWVDPIAAILVGIYITFLAIGLLSESAAGLMDRQDVSDAKLLERILDSHLGPSGKPPQICSYHKLRHRHSGRYHWVDFHIMVPANIDIARGHEIASAIEYEIEQALGEGNATAHVEPCVDATCEACGEEIRHPKSAL
jgi:cation diffusion facilitator family transporter